MPPCPAEIAQEIRRIAKHVTYGWGMIPVETSLGEVAFRSSLFPKDETYLLPLKAEVRRRAGITAGDSIIVEMSVQPASRSL